MIDFNKPHMVPQTTKSLAQGAESSRHRQAKAYDMDRANNHRQMDDIRHAQYRKQNTAVKQQKSHMQDNAAKASKRITGSSDYYKEGITLDAFLEICEDVNRMREIRRIDAQKRQKAKAKLKKSQDEKKKQSAITKYEGPGVKSGATTSPGDGKPKLGSADKSNPARDSAKQKRRMTRGASAVKAKQARKEQQAREKAAAEKSASDEANRKEKELSDRKKKITREKTKSVIARVKENRREKKKAADAEAREAAKAAKQREKEEQKKREQSFGGRFKKRLMPGDRGKKMADAVYDSPKNALKLSGKAAKGVAKGAVGLAGRAVRGSRASSQYSAPSGGSISSVDKVND